MSVLLARNIIRGAGQRSFSLSARAMQPKKPSIQAIGELRKRLPGTSMLKAREALLASRTTPDEDNVDAALAWLQEDMARSGAKKAAKVANRAVREGVVAVAVLTDGATPAAPGAQAAIVEVNCETDFVARNDVFGQLVRDIAHTAAMLPTLANATTDKSAIVDLDLQQLLACPLIPSNPEAAANHNQPLKSVADSITDVVSRLGERISVARVAAVQGEAVPAPTAPRRDPTSIVNLASAFAHGGASSPSPTSQPGYVMSTGRVASLLLTRLTGSAPDSARALTRSLARQTAGMTTRTIRDSNSASLPTHEAPEASEALYSQPFIMLLPAAAPTPESNGLTVHQVLEQYAQANSVQVDVTDMRRWELGETAEPQPDVDPDAFANQVKKAAGLA